MKKSILAVLVMTVFLMLMGSPSVSHATDVKGKFCWQMDSYADLWVWYIEEVAPGFYQVTGYDVYNGAAAMNGGGYRDGSVIRLSVQEESPYYNIHGTHAIEMTLPGYSGTTDLYWETWEGVPYATYQDLTFQKITCPAALEADSDLPSTSGR
jgi:hypothetical protein